MSKASDFEGLKKLATLNDEHMVIVANAVIDEVERQGRSSLTMPTWMVRRLIAMAYVKLRLKPQTKGT